jgi:hypothetical protein
MTCVVRVARAGSAITAMKAFRSVLAERERLSPGQFQTVGIAAQFSIERTFALRQTEDLY